MVWVDLVTAWWTSVAGRVELLAAWWSAAAVRAELVTAWWGGRALMIAWQTAEVGLVIALQSFAAGRVEVVAEQLVGRAL